MDRLRLIKLWARQHGALEVRFRAAIDQFFDQQLRRVLAALRGFSHPSPAIVPQLIRVDDEHEWFMEMARPHLIGAMATGAATELQRFEDQKSFAKAAEFELPPEFTFEGLISDDIAAAMQATLSEVEAQPYWHDIQKTSETRIAGIVSGFQEGLNVGQMASRIRDAMHDINRKRGLSIARTELTGMLNAGHQTAYDDLARDGLLSGKTWDAILDRDLRDSHRALHGVTVRPNENFIVGPSQTPAPYPGYHLLPVEERANCRCGTLGRTVADASREELELDPVDDEEFIALMGLASFCGVHGKQG